MFMMEATVEEEEFPHSSDERHTLVKQATLWFRIHGILDRIQTVAKHLAALITRMENRESGPHRGPPDYPPPPNQAPWVYYGGSQPEPSHREPSWQNKILGIVGSLVVAGILAIFGVLWSMNSKQVEMNGRLSKIEEHQSGEHDLTVQRLDQQDKHLEATDKRVDDHDRRLNELERTWVRRP